MLESTLPGKSRPPTARTTRCCAHISIGLVGVLALLGCQSMPTEPVATAAAPNAAAPPGPLPDTSALSAREPLAARPVLALEGLPSPPPDLLERLRQAFMLSASTEPTVLRELQWFSSHPEYLERVFTRGERYLFYIAEAIEARGMPADLALLPIVESAFDPFAYSHGRASGLWQIIPGTGRRLGLKQNWWYDGRRDVIDSTRAALDYLEQLHRQFDGDWLLAVAGYNSGEGNVARAIRRAEAAGQATDFWGIRRYLPVETRTYVPRLLAIRDLVADPDAHGVSLPEIDNTAYFTVVDAGAQIDMTLAAQLAGIEPEMLYLLNPGVNRWATDPDGPYHLAVPTQHSEAFDLALQSLGERERVQWTRHRVRSGETLSHLALKYQTTEDVLREINELRGHIIRAGDYLMIPHALETLQSYTQSLDVRRDRQTSRRRNGERHLHVVAAGESLWTISRRYDVNVRALASWNAMAPGDVLNAGKQLVVWTTAAPQLTGQANNAIRRVNYVVRRGDSLSSIATRFRVTVGKLMEWNNVAAEKYLQPGQRLVMYVDVTEQSI